MARPAYVKTVAIHSDSSLDASPETSSASINVTAAGHTLLLFMTYERAGTTSEVIFEGITRNGQSFRHVRTEGLSTSTSAIGERQALWILENADTGDYPVIFTHNGLTGNDICATIIEFDSGYIAQVSGDDNVASLYAPGSGGVVGTVALTIGDDATIVIGQQNIVAGTTWGSAFYGTKTLENLAASGSAGTALAVAYYEAAAGEHTGLGIDFTPFSNNWGTYGRNTVIAVELSNAPTNTNLVINDSTHGITSDIILLDAGNTLVVGAETAHAVSSDNITLSVTNLFPNVLTADQDAEIGGSANSATWTGTNTFKLVMEADDQSDMTGWLNIIRRVSVKANTVVTLEANLASHQAGLQGNNIGWCYYDVTLNPITVDSKAKWCTNRVKTANKGYIRGDLPESTEDKVYLISFQPVWKEAFNAQVFTKLRSRFNTHELPSVAAARIADPTLPESGYAWVAPGTRTQQNSVATSNAAMMGIRITNTGFTPPGGKIIVRYTYQAHASEHQGDWAWWERINWLTTESVGADEILRQYYLNYYDFYVYCVNPLGRRYGKERFTEEAGGDEDPNRAYDDSGSAQVNALKSANTTDYGGSMNVSFDSHGFGSLGTNDWTSAFALYEMDPLDYPGLTVPTEFNARLKVKLGDFHVEPSLAGPGESASGQAQLLGAVIHETLEYAYGGPGFYDASGEVRITYSVPGIATFEVMKEMQEDGWFGSFLGINDASHTHTVDNTALAQEHTLVINDTAHSQAVDNVGLSQATQLSIQNATHTHSVEGLTLSMETALVVADCAHTHTSENATLTIATVLTINDATHGHVVDSATLAQKHTLAIADSSHNQTVEGLTLSLSASLSVDSATHTQVVDGIALSQKQTLTIADALHAQTAEGVTLSLSASLTVDSTTHSHTADGIASVKVSLLIQDATHPQLAENLTLLQAGALDIASATHLHTVEVPTLAQKQSIVIADATHTHTVEAPTLLQRIALAVADALHSQAVDNVTLAQGTILTITDSIHSHEAASLILSMKQFLTIADTLHNHLAENAYLAQGMILDIASTVHGLTSETPELDVTILLGVQDSRHSQVVDVVKLGVYLGIQDTDHLIRSTPADLSQAQFLSINDGFHTVLSDVMVTVSDGVILVQDSQRIIYVEALSNIVYVG